MAGSAGAHLLVSGVGHLPASIARHHGLNAFQFVKNGLYTPETARAEGSFGHAFHIFVSLLHVTLVDKTAVYAAIYKTTGRLNSYAGRLLCTQVAKQLYICLCVPLKRF